MATYGISGTTAVNATGTATRSSLSGTTSTTVYTVPAGSFLDCTISTSGSAQAVSPTTVATAGVSIGGVGVIGMNVNGGASVVSGVSTERFVVGAGSVIAATAFLNNNGGSATSTVVVIGTLHTA